MVRCRTIVPAAFSPVMSARKRRLDAGVVMKLPRTWTPGGSGLWVCQMASATHSASGTYQSLRHRRRGRRGFAAVAAEGARASGAAIERRARLLAVLAEDREGCATRGAL